MNINLTLLGQMISFGIFVWFTMKYIWPPLVDALEARKAKIADGLSAAERGQLEQELAQKRATELMREAKLQATDVIAHAQKRAAQIIDEAKEDARGEGERMLEAARAEIQQEMNRAREELRGKIAVLAIAAAEKILEREVDAKAHEALIDSFVERL